MSTSSQPSSDATIVKVGWIQKRGMYICLYNELSYACILIGSHVCLLEDRRIDDVIIKTFFNSLLYKTNRFQVAMRLFISDVVSVMFI